jgi:hypothetical protein
MQTAIKHLRQYSDSVAPLRVAASRFLEEPTVVAEDGVLQIGHRPWVAELNYMFTLYPGIAPKPLERYQKTFHISIPPVYVRLLAELNGAFCFGISLFGVPKSMISESPQLDRTVLQCLDLGTAMKHWVNEYHVPPDFFHFGSREISATAIAGYFIDQHDRIHCATKKGKTIGQWSDYRSFFTDELATSEKLEQKLNPRPKGKPHE